MKKIIFLLSFSSIFLFAQWKEDLTILAILDSKETALTHFYNQQNSFKKDIYKQAEKIINQILKTPLSDKERHIQLHNKLMFLYTCKDYISLRKNEKTNGLLNKSSFLSLVLKNKENTQKYKEHLKIIINEKTPLPSNEQMIKDKKECISIYHKYKEDLVSF